DNVGVTRVEFVVNGAVAFTAPAAPYLYSWNTASLSGAQTLSVKAYDAAGNTATGPARTVYVKPLPPAPPAVPALLSPADGATNVFTSPTLSWSAAAGALSYRLQVAGDPGFATLVYDDSTLTATAQLVGPLTAGTTYHWRVCASNTWGNSAFASAWSCTTSNPAPTDSIPAPAVLRDDFSAPNGPLPGRSKWTTIANSPLNGSMDIVSAAIQPRVDTGYYNFGGIVWDTLMSPGTEAGLTLRQKSGNSSWTSLFIYGRMNNKDFNTGTGYRLRYLEQPGTDELEIQKVGPGYSISTSLATAYYEVNPGDAITFRVLSDNRTMEGLVNGVKVISAMDSSLTPAQWYFAFRACVFPTAVRFDNFAVSTHKPASLASPMLLSPPKDAAGQSVNLGFSWNPVAGASWYRLQLSVDSTFVPTLVDDSALTAPSDTVRSLANGGRYFWRVSALSSAGAGPYAGPWSFTTVAGNAVLVVNRRTINFGKVRVGSTKKDSILIRNSGNSPLRVSSIQSSSPLFQPSPGTAMLQPAGQQNVYVTFSPQQRGAASGLIVSACDSSGGASSPPIILFGPVQPGSSVTRSATISNTGDFDLLITDIQSTNADFRITPRNVAIAPAESVRFQITATPTTSQLETAQFVFIDNSGSSSDTLVAQLGSPSGVDPGNGPKEYALLQNYPNPFNPQTFIRYTIPVPSRVVLRVFNILGEQIATLVNDVEDPGVKSVVWNGTDRRGLVVASGLYFYRLEAADLQEPNRKYVGHQKMIFAK
ncbi:MAG: choice-of-anchor D domain-containing protein, partial [Ignavibacteria bacterium]